MSEAPIAKDDAAVKIQAAYRGYRERKTLSHVRNKSRCVPLQPTPRQRRLSIVRSVARFDRIEQLLDLISLLVAT